MNGAGQTVKYGYDLGGNLTGLTYPNGSQVTRAYDAADRLQKVTDWLSHSTTFGYDPNSNLTSEAYPNGTTATFRYDNADNLTQIHDLKGSSTLWTFGYSRDADNQLQTNTDPIEVKNHTYSYDALNRLSGDGSAGGNTTFGYDAADRLKTITANTTSTLGYDNADELTSLVKQHGTSTTQNLTLSYNADGDRTRQSDSVSKTSSTFGYNQDDQLISYAKGSSGWTYKYDGDGLRASKTAGTATTDETWDVAEGLPLLVQDASTSYVTGVGGVPLAADRRRFHGVLLLPGSAREHACPAGRLGEHGRHICAQSVREPLEQYW
ncbi:MAG: hypothetical protein DLM70_14710 [Chloroflexi bacterium]|nr:MAG: hypothetical protein DLM70_14710 [Chloroflexota bacterium]